MDLATVITLLAGMFLTPLLGRLAERLGIKLPINPSPNPLPGPTPTPSPSPSNPFDLTAIVELLYKMLLDRFLPHLEARLEAKMIQVVANRPPVDIQSKGQIIPRGDGSFIYIPPTVEKAEVKA
jgi:hypothetical protein